MNAMIYFIFPFPMTIDVIDTNPIGDSKSLRTTIKT